MSYAEITAAVVSALIAQHQIPPVPAAEVNCLAEAIYYEAGNQDRRGQLLVADVVMNRVASPRFPNTACGVIYQRGQFTFHRRPLPSRARDQFRGIAELAARRYVGQIRPRTNATFFYNYRMVRPAWSRRLVFAEQHGPHIFMSLPS